MNRILDVDAERAGGLGRAGRAQPRPVPGGRRTSGCTSPPTRRASSRARSAATWPTTPAAPTACCYGVTTAHVLAVEVVLPDGDGRPCSAGSTPTRRATTCGARSSAARGPWASPPASRCGSPRCRRRCVTLLADFTTGRGGRGHRQRHHRRRHRARRPRDDGRRASPPRSRTSSTPASRPTRPPCCSSRSTGCRPGWRPPPTRSSGDRPRPRGPGRAGGRRPGRAGPAVEGPQVGLRRHRPHRPQLLPARRRRAPDQAGRGAAPRSTRIAERYDLDHGQRVPRRRRQPAPADRVRPPRPRA